MEILSEILGQLGISAEGGVGFIVIVLAARAGAKYIPDSATGALGALRKVLKVLGAYTENKA
jgi:hypothetical protein